MNIEDLKIARTIYYFIGGGKLMLNENEGTTNNTCESNFLCLKSCNVCTCIHYANGHCTSFKGDECEMYEVQLIQEN